MKLQACECTQILDLVSHQYGFFYTTALTTTGILFAHIAARLFSHKTGFIINPRFYFSEKLCLNLDKLMLGFRSIESKLAALITFGKVSIEAHEFIEQALIAPIAEELLFRAIIQNILLLNLLQSLGINCLDSSYYSTFRIMVTASLFATAHMNYWDGKEGIIPEFASGLIFGIAKEYFGIGTAIAAHILINAKNIAEEIDKVR